MQRRQQVLEAAVQNPEPAGSEFPVDAMSRPSRLRKLCSSFQDLPLPLQKATRTQIGATVDLIWLLRA